MDKPDIVEFAEKYCGVKLLECQKELLKKNRTTSYRRIICGDASSAPIIFLQYADYVKNSWLPIVKRRRRK